jgi:methylmalonyl-CoA/ethylmalonyl-CoA epimerase
MKIRGIHHIGMLVRDARATAKMLDRALGLKVTAWEDYGPGLLRIGFIPTRSTLLELIEPLTGDGFNAQWLRERGEGIQHIALQVDDIDGAVRSLKRRGIALQDDRPRPGAAGTRIAFLSRASTGDLLVELTQPRKRPGRRPQTTVRSPRGRRRTRRSAR